ncbi:VIR protein [Plasmodium vivax]|uniref:VIR protein n=1 Tax=Plasmodium vivax TaxID=5855 RepID=A0A1G4GVT7_PLAVI|nr:VIR protein [Plasmodium vivax]
MAQVTYVDNNVCKKSPINSCEDLHTEIIYEVKEKVSGLNTSDNAEIFLQTCRELVSYLNNYSGDCIKCYTGDNLHSYKIENDVENLLKRVTKYGGCPRNFTSDDEERIQLTYKVEQFCSEKNGYISKIQALERSKTESSCRDKEFCNAECSEYEKWLTEQEKHFLNEEIKKKYMNLKRSNKIEFPNNCDVTEKASFENNINYCVNVKGKKPPPKEIHTSDLCPTDEVYTRQITASEQIPDYNSHTKYAAGLNHLDYAILEEIAPDGNEIYEFRSVRKPCDAHIKHAYKIDAEPTNIETYQDTHHSSISEASNEEIAKTESGEETVSEQITESIMLDGETHTLNPDPYRLPEENDSIPMEQSNSDETISGTPYKMYLLFILMKLGLFFYIFSSKKGKVKLS